MGLPIPAPEEAVYTDADLEVARLTAPVRAAAGITDEELLELLRALGRGLSQAAETMRALPLRSCCEPGHQRARHSPNATPTTVAQLVPDAGAR